MYNRNKFGLQQRLIPHAYLPYIIQLTKHIYLNVSMQIHALYTSHAYHGEYFITNREI